VMNEYLKYLFSLLILFIVISCGSLIVNSVFRLEMSVVSVISLVLSFTVSTLISLLVFLRGLSRKPDVQAMHSFVSTGIKFLSELFIALIWFVAAKKTSAEYILLFFVLYLAFSMFFIKVILKALKKKSL
jgi:hypothetical protein